ncbi:uncharacterized protein LOC106162098 [Lingula anatina]|uniref:Uncharacterized protein LOC106162098 n=1 Tax=Lingula anatina TaxID=7574 RepID=A0A1S3I8W0_LINAN|nr:uncharacterized protein LOC106162098 [Lingula anatina]|eukprot:XP_013394687.1 uncharacterized protein LOC106162098 [Lingula anatina]
MEAIKECIYISLLVLISTMMPRVTECFQSLQATNSCISLNKRYLPALTNNLSPEYIKTSEELKNQIRDAGYDSTHYIEFYESYGGTLLAYVKIRVTKIGEEDSMEEDLKKATLNVLSVNNSCDCEVCKKWSGWYPCPQVNHPGGESRCSLNLCIPRKCRPEMKVNSTGNSITKKTDDCPTRPMTNITNRDQKGEDKDSNTHGADNSWTTPKTNTSNTEYKTPAPQDHSSVLGLGIFAAISVALLIIVICIGCAMYRRIHRSYCCS